MVNRQKNINTFSFTFRYRQPNIAVNTCLISKNTDQLPLYQFKVSSKQGNFHTHKKSLCCLNEATIDESMPVSATIYSKSEAT